MRKSLVLLAAAAVVLGVFSPAQAKTKKYSIGSVKLEVYSGGKYNKWSDIDISENHENDKVRISGKISGGPSKNKGLTAYAYNTSDGNKKSRVDKITISSSGSFRIYDHPERAGRIKYEIRKAKRGSYKAATTKNVYVNTYAFFPLSYLYDPADNLPQEDPTLVEGPIDNSDNTEKTLVPTANSPQGEMKEFGKNYFIDGGGTLVADVSGYRCKKFTMHAGVSSSSKTESVTYATFVNTGQIYGFSGTRTKSNLEHNLTHTRLPYFSTVKITVAPAVEVPDDQVTPEDETVNPSDPRMMIGNPKVFCMFPNVDPLHP